MQLGRSCRLARMIGPCIAADRPRMTRCRVRDSNPHAFRRRILSALCLPIPPTRRGRRGLAARDIAAPAGAPSCRPRAAPPGAGACTASLGWPRVTDQLRRARPPCRRRRGRGPDPAGHHRDAARRRATTSSARRATASRPCGSPRSCGPTWSCWTSRCPSWTASRAAERIVKARIAPVVLLTAFSQRELVERARDAGAMAYVVKPFTAGGPDAGPRDRGRRHEEIEALESEVADLPERFETRKLVDRAKGLLQTKIGMSEPEAFRWIQKTSMDRRLTHARGGRRGGRVVRLGHRLGGAASADAAPRTNRAAAGPTAERGLIHGMTGRIRHDSLGRVRIVVEMGSADLCGRFRARTPMVVSPRSTPGRPVPAVSHAEEVDMAKPIRAVAVVAVGALGLAACASGSSSGSRPRRWWWQDPDHLHRPAAAGLQQGRLGLDQPGDRAVPEVDRQQGRRLHDPAAEVRRLHRGRGQVGPGAVPDERAEARATPDEVAVMGTLNSGCAKIEVPVLNQAPNGPMLMVSHANTNVGLTRPWDPASRTSTTRRASATTRAWSPPTTSRARPPRSSPARPRREEVLHPQRQRDVRPGRREGLPGQRQKNGIQILGNDAWDPKATSYTSIFQKIQAAGADCVFLGGIYDNGGGAAHQGQGRGPR